MTWRRLAILVNHLPGESAYKTAVRDAIPDDQLAALAKLPREGHGTWSHSDLLAAAQIDVMRSVLHLLASRFSGKSQPPPEPWPRPGVVSTSKRRALSPEGHAYLMQIRREHEREHGYSTTPDADAG